MTRRQIRLRVLSATGMAAALWMGAVQALHANESHSTRACSNATLNGSYGFYRTGTTSKGPIAAVGLIIFDGKGNSTATQSISRNGVIEFDVTLPGTYQIGGDCTGKGFTPDGNEIVRLVVVDAGKGLLLLSETPGNSVYGVGTRTHGD